MTVDEFKETSEDFPKSILDTDLKRICFDILSKSCLVTDQMPRILPPIISECLLKCQPNVTYFSSSASQSAISNLKISGDRHCFSSETVKEMLSFHVQILTLQNCFLPSNLSLRELSSIESENCKIDTLILEGVNIASDYINFMKIIGSLMQRITCLRYISVYPTDSFHQIDETFAKLARDYLSKNSKLSFLDIRGSDIDLMATSSRRNLPINFAGEMRRWARRLKGLGFETDVNIIRVLKILNRQCPLLKSVCIKYRQIQTVSEAFDNIKMILDTSDIFEHSCIEPLPKLKRLCLCGHYRVTDSILKYILPSLPVLKYLNITGCAVNFEQYWMYLPSSLEELVIDECDRSLFLKENRTNIRRLLQNCPNLIIFISKPYFEGEDFESLKGLALLNGAKSVLSQYYENLLELENDDLISFELRIKVLDYKVPCIKIF